uniref:Uncharacterized protein n=1 Tax=Globisporangium ultimum (strain ATCC 200006 / CBS 805.95 / DAOM BR144) TaxID=431595 RepID=K3XAJ1_GLOUD
MGIRRFFRCIGQIFKGGKTSATRRELHTRDYNSVEYHRVLAGDIARTSEFTNSGGRRLTTEQRKANAMKRLQSSFAGNDAFDRQLEERLSVTTARMEDLRRHTFIGSPESPAVLSSSTENELVECVPGTDIPICDTSDPDEVVKVYARLMAAKREFEIAEQELKHVKEQVEEAELHGRRSASKLPPAHLRPKRAQPRSAWI